METRLRMRDLQLLIAIDEHKSISSAAASLRLAQPAASRTLMEMEQTLRVHLFERDRGKGMSATSAGELVLARARAILADCRLMTMELEAHRSGIGGHLRLGVIPFAPGSMIQRLISVLIGAEHRMSVAVTEGSTTQLMHELQREKLDAIIARCSTAEIAPGLTQETLFRQEACLIAHKLSPLVRKEQIRLTDLADSTWLLPPRGTPTRLFIDEAFVAAGMLPPSPLVEAGSSRIIHLIIRANRHMLGVIPSDVGTDLQALGGVRSLPFPAPMKMPAVGLIYAKRHRETPAVSTLRLKARELSSKPAPA
ncbi:MAG: LysR family transcriptional regulator [Betaproteobacteria bacterium]